jgi:hypothetical protein
VVGQTDILPAEGFRRFAGAHLPSQARAVEHLENQGEVWGQKCRW